MMSSRVYQYASDGYRCEKGLTLMKVLRSGGQLQGMAAPLKPLQFLDDIDWLLAVDRCGER